MKCKKKTFLAILHIYLNNVYSKQPVVYGTIIHFFFDNLLLRNYNKIFHLK